jgi:hypothetical protein
VVHPCGGVVEVKRGEREDCWMVGEGRWIHPDSVRLSCAG